MLLEFLQGFLGALKGLQKQAQKIVGFWQTERQTFCAIKLELIYTIRYLTGKFDPQSSVGRQCRPIVQPRGLQALLQAATWHAWLP